MAKNNLLYALNQRAEERAIVAPDVAYDAMFGIKNLTTVNAVTQLPLAELRAFSKHPFKLYTQEKLNALAQSIAENGLQQPVIVRTAPENCYEILAGHNRVAAFQLNGEMQIPAIIVDADDDQAAMIVTETNLQQREKLLPSERAFAYKLQLEAIKHQGKIAKDTTSTQVGWKCESANLVAEENGASKNDVRRHIRLTELIIELLDMVDNKKLTFTPAVELSYLQKVEQTNLLKIIEKTNTAPSLSQAQKLKKFSQDGKLTTDVIDAIMTEEKPETTKVTLSGERLRKYFPGAYTQKQIEETIISLLEDWLKKQEE